MKKTLVTLLVLGGMAMADTAQLTVGTSAITLSNELMQLQLTKIEGSSTTVGTTVGVCDTSAVTGATGFSPKIQFIQALNEDELSEVNGDCYWLLTFTLQNKTNTDISIDGFSFTMNATTGTGGSHGTGIGEVTNTITFSNDTDYSATWDLGANSASDTETINTSFTLAAKQTETFTLKVQRTESHRGSAITGYAALTAGSLSYSVIPEPATATLSLLAIAGLAVRRRRK